MRFQSPLNCLQMTLGILDDLLHWTHCFVPMHVISPCLRRLQPWFFFILCTEFVHFTMVAVVTFLTSERLQYDSRTWDLATCNCMWVIALCYYIWDCSSGKVLPGFGTATFIEGQHAFRQVIVLKCCKKY